MIRLALMRIKILITGGTIDKLYNKFNGELEFDNTHFDQILKRSCIDLEVISKVLFLKDSLDMTDDDRALILSECLSSDEDRILITHGTDTMVKTADFLGTQIKDKTIVLFGSMTPYSINNSDALFNFGVAISAVQTKDSGVYIAMNGKAFDFDKVEKNKSLGIFVDS